MPPPFRGLWKGEPHMIKPFARMVGCMAMALCAVLFGFAEMWFGEERSALRLARVIVFEQRRAEALQYRSEAVKHSLESKERIISELIGGRLRLRQAIVQFQRVTKELNEKVAMEGADQSLIAAFVPPPTDPESVARLILVWVRVDLGMLPPDKAERRLADLTSELRELVGRVSLPDSTAGTERACQDMD